MSFNRVAAVLAYVASETLKGKHNFAKNHLVPRRRTQLSFSWLCNPDKRCVTRQVTFPSPVPVPGSPFIQKVSKGINESAQHSFFYFRKKQILHKNRRHHAMENGR